MKLLRGYAMSLHGKSAQLMSETSLMISVRFARSAVFARPARLFVCFAFFFHFDTFPRCVDVVQCHKMI